MSAADSSTALINCSLEWDLQCAIPNSFYLSSLLVENVFCLAGEPWRQCCMIDVVSSFSSPTPFTVASGIKLWSYSLYQGEGWVPACRTEVGTLGSLEATKGHLRVSWKPLHHSTLSVEKSRAHPLASHSSSQQQVWLCLLAPFQTSLFKNKLNKRQWAMLLS